MNFLEITEARAKKLDEIEGGALEILLNAVEGKIAADDEQAKLAIKVLAIVGKRRQIQNRIESLTLIKQGKFTKPKRKTGPRSV
jgi:hypothetical protein